MKKLLPILLALVTLSSTQAKSAPVVPAIAPAATEVLDKSAQAYARLDSASMSFTAFDQIEVKGKTTTEHVTGTLVFARPNKAKLEFKSGNDTTIYLTNGTRYIEQLHPNEYQEYRFERSQGSTSGYIESVLRNIPSGLSVFLPLMAADKWKYARQDFRIQTMTLLPDYGVKLTAKVTGDPLPPITFWLYFDPTDHLLRRVEAKLTFQGQTRHNITLLTKVQSNPDLSPKAFAFTPAPGAKRANRSIRPLLRLRPR